MIGKILCALLLVCACSGANVSDFGLKEDIEQGKTKIEKIKANSAAYIKETKNKFAEDADYIKSCIQTYKEEAKSALVIANEKVNITTRKYIGEAIDKNKNINSFRCIAKARSDALSAIEQSSRNVYDCINKANDTFFRQSDPLLDQVDLIMDAVSGLYEILINSLDSCKDSNCVSELVHKAEERENNLKKVLRSFEGKSSELKQQCNQGSIDCMRGLTFGLNNAVTQCENKMKAC